ncbi:MAG TPA: YihY family inner membrane protein [Spirochaetes bacterium]|nr:YihY family inner membrane protein [Spirochaetota bacterium]
MKNEGLRHLNLLIRIYRITAQTLKRFIKDRCDIEARALSFVSLLSLVPLLTIILLGLRRFSFYDRIKEELFRVISDYILPEMTAKIVGYIESILEDTGSIGFFGIIVTIGIAFLLFIALSRGMNHIWRSRRSRAILYTFLKFIIIIVCVPALIVATFYLQNYLSFQKYLSYLPDFMKFNLRLTKFFSLVLHWVLLFVVYSFIPHRKVKFAHALTAGVVTGSLWYLLRRGLTIYVRVIPQINVLYGSLAFIPIFLIWLYCTWVIVLFGVELNYTFHSQEK